MEIHLSEVRHLPKVSWTFFNDIFQWHRLAPSKFHFEQAQCDSIVLSLQSFPAPFQDFISITWQILFQLHMRTCKMEKYFVWTSHRVTKYLNSQRIIGFFLEHRAEFYFKIFIFTSQMLPPGAVRARHSLPPSLLLPEQPWETSLKGSSSVVISLFIFAANWFCLLEREADLKFNITLLFPRCTMAVSVL